MSYMNTQYQRCNPASRIEAGFIHMLYSGEFLLFALTEAIHEY